jgi:hypothetical protein
MRFCRGSTFSEWQSIMMRRSRGSSALCLALTALLVLVALPGLAEAAITIGFRNDTKGPIIVQGMAVVNGRILLSKRLTIQPGATAWDIVLVPGNKVITIADGKQPTRTLGQETIQTGIKNLFFAIEPDEDQGVKSDKNAKPKKAGEDKSAKSDKNAKPKNDSPKVKLTPTTPPTMPMGTTPLPMRR